MRRKFFTFCSLVSLLLCVAVCGLWARTVYRTDIIGVARRGSEHIMLAKVISSGGRLNLSLENYQLRTVIPSATFWNVGPPSILEPHTLFKPQVLTPPAGELKRDAFVQLPHWFVAMATAVMPTIWMGKRRKDAARAPPGLCQACGYDLRGTPGRCPECGTAAENRPPHNQPTMDRARVKPGNEVARYP